MALPSDNMKKIVKRVLDSLDGFSFQTGDNVLGDENGFFATFLDADPRLGSSYSPDEARAAVVNRMAAALSFCLKNNGDVYLRLRGAEETWLFVMAAWNPLSPMLFRQLAGVMGKFEAARRRYLSEGTSGGGSAGKSNGTKLTIVMDRYIKLVDQVATTNAPRRPSALSAAGIPQHIPVANGVNWPPAYFANHDVAIMADPAVRKSIYGMTPSATGSADDLKYPNDQDGPQAIRQYLCSLALCNIKSNTTISCFLSPVAFLTDEHRAEWYKATGHQSRFYGTVTEILKYAEDAMVTRTEKPKSDHAVCVLTPWFFDQDAMVQMAAERDEAIPLAWKKRCFRRGIALILSTKRTPSGRIQVQMTLFRPGLPHYSLAAEPIGQRREKQDGWIKELIDMIGASFTIREVFSSGKTKMSDAPPADRGISADSIELAHQFVTEIIEDPGSLPATAKDLEQRGFKSGYP